MFGHPMSREEIESLNKVMDIDDHRCYLGGARVSSKITIIESILDKVNDLIIVGGILHVC
jgi:phosphoglycerate kinase